MTIFACQIMSGSGKAEQMSSYGDATCYIRALLTKF
uniref:Uncharacterized protein n=1 Tax=Anguilla anguilla TaxID=7936 RepID=A0A0E9VJA0_ANGAN